MALKEDLKALIIKSGWTMTQVVEELNNKYNRNTSVQNFSAKLKRESLKYTEVEEILNIIGYEIKWNKAENTVYKIGNIGDIEDNNGTINISVK